MEKKRIVVFTIAKRLAAAPRGWHILGRALFLTFFVLSFTLLCTAQDSNKSKIPEGEAHFTPEQMEEYSLVYKNPDVRYLRTLFDAYVNKSGGTQQERQLLDKWSKAYFQSKFIVMSRDNNMFGGTLITILFQDRPDKVFIAWVYSEGNEKKLTLKGLSLADFSDEDIRRIKVRDRKLIEDKSHAM